MATSDLNIVVKAKNEASATLKKVQTDLGGLDKAAGFLKGGLVGAAAAVGVGAIVELGGAIADMAQKAAQVEILSASFDQLARSAGQSSSGMLRAMRQASDGLISDSGLMLSANKAMMLGVADTAEELTALLEVARSRGAAMGLDTAQAFNDIVTGLGRMSPLILDNLGITVNMEAAMQEYAASLGTTAAALTDAQRKQALLNAVMAQSAGMSAEPIDNAATAIQRMNVAIENAQVALGQMFGPTVAAGAQSLADAINAVIIASQLANGEITGLDRTLVGLQQRAEQLAGPNAQFSMALFGGLDANQQKQAFEDIAAGIEAARAAAAAGVPTGKAWVDTLSRIADESLRTGTVSQANAMIVESLIGVMQGVTVATDQTAQAMQRVPAAASAMASGLSQVQAAAGATMGIIYNLAGAINSLNAVSATRPDALDSVLGSINSLSGSLIPTLGIDAALAKGDELKVQSRQRAEELRAIGYAESDIALILQSEVSETGRLLTATQNVGGAVAGVSQEYSDLQSKVQGVLSEALGDLGGFDPASMLPREDAIAENARRLAAIANEGLANQPWLEEFKREVPEVFAEIANSPDPRQAAARIAQEFQAGLRPELLDKEAAKARVRQMILGDQNMAAIATEIAQELAAEMGIPLQEAMAAAGAALGVPTAATGEGAAAGAAGATPPDMTSSGASAGTTFVTGFQTTATGTLLVATIVQQMEGAILSFQTPGQNAGKTWGSGFMSTVETSIAAPLINLLVTLVTPGVMAQLATANTQTTPP